MTTPRWGREEAASVHLLPGYGWAPIGDSAYEPHWLDAYDRIAQSFDELRLPDGSVLMDTQYTFALFLKSSRPHQFVIPSDLDFEPTVADPKTYGVRYLLITNGSADVLSRQYPADLSSGRASITVGKLVWRKNAGPQSLSLYRVTRSVTDTRGTIRSG